MLSVKDLSSSRTFSKLCLILATCIRRSFGFVIVFRALLVFSLHLYIASFVLQNKYDHFQHFLNFVPSFLMSLSISAYFELLSCSLLCRDCKALLLLKYFCISRSVFCNAFQVLTWISSAKDESSISDTLSIFMSVGN